MREVTSNSETQFDKSFASNCLYFKQFLLRINLLFNFTITTDIMSAMLLLSILVIDVYMYAIFACGKTTINNQYKRI